MSPRHVEPPTPTHRAVRAWLLFGLACAAIGAARVAIGIDQTREGREQALRTERWNAEHHADSHTLYRRIKPLIGLPRDELLRRAGLDAFPRHPDYDGVETVDVPAGFDGLRRAYRVRLTTEAGRVTSFHTRPLVPFPRRREDRLYRMSIRLGEVLQFAGWAGFVLAAALLVRERVGPLRRDRARVAQYGQYALAAGLVTAVGWLTVVGSRATLPSDRVTAIGYLCTAPVLAAALLAWGLLRHGPTPGVCTRCKYDLTGNVSGTCPECGTPTAAPPAPPTLDNANTA